MNRPAILSLGKLTALCTLTAIVIVLRTAGQEMFSPGALNAQTRGTVPLGGVSSHAELAGNCSACHVSPWSKETMTTRCLDCHTEVREQLDGERPLHGLLAPGMHCRECHTEHRGTHGRLTSFHKFDHDCAGFKLTGKHRGVECASCHTNNTYKGAPHDCRSCHGEPDIHRGKFGTDCAHCHSTLGWEGATFAHSFPLNHGRGKKNTSACATCHLSNNYQEYTCHGCHRHDPVKTAQKHVKKGIADVSGCAVCHPTGRKRKPAVALNDLPSTGCAAEGAEVFSGWDAHRLEEFLLSAPRPVRPADDITTHAAATPTMLKREQPLPDLPWGFSLSLSRVTNKSRRLSYLLGE
jgi:hypothetical protein